MNYCIRGFNQWFAKYNFAPVEAPDQMSRGSMQTFFNNNPLTWVLMDTISSLWYFLMHANVAWLTHFEHPFVALIWQGRDGVMSDSLPYFCLKDCRDILHLIQLRNPLRHTLMGESRAQNCFLPISMNTTGCIPSSPALLWKMSQASSSKAP